MGNDSVDCSCNDDFDVEVEMDVYTNNSDQPHKLTIRVSKTKELVLTKKFETEGLAFSYMYEAMEFSDNKKNFSFCITGPNTYYYQG